jgi:hypothetical protein
MTAYQMSLISARSILLDSTFNFFGGEGFEMDGTLGQALPEDIVQ